MTIKCPKCNHIYMAGETHECPTSEYIAARNQLVNEAANADVTEGHEHQWGPLEHSRLGGIAHRKCQIDGCNTINALDDE